MKRLDRQRAVPSGLWSLLQPPRAQRGLGGDRVRTRVAFRSAPRVMRGGDIAQQLRVTRGSDGLRSRVSATRAPQRFVECVDRFIPPAEEQMRDRDIAGRARRFADHGSRGREQRKGHRFVRRGARNGL